MAITGDAGYSQAKDIIKILIKKTTPPPPKATY
jgi:hypothetical protein